MSKTSQVKEMFDSIAPAYDFMNRAMTVGVDKWWRRKAVQSVAAANPHAVLDLATGTGDLAIALARRMPTAKITGADLSPQMLEIAHMKVQRKGLQLNISLHEADGTALPWAEASFDAVTIAYGIRNFENINAGYSEMYRVLKPGGTLTVVELATPVNPVALSFYKLYTRWLIPALGRLISRKRRAYSYLPESIAAVPQRERMLELIEKAGFSRATHRPLTFGTCIIYTASKPAT